MSRWFVILTVVAMLFAFGCSNEWLEHDTVYKTNDHMWYSMGGYHNTDAEDLNNQTRQGGWWGDAIPYTDAE